MGKIYLLFTVSLKSALSCAVHSLDVLNFSLDTLVSLLKTSLLIQGHVGVVLEDAYMRL